MTNHNTLSIAPEITEQVEKQVENTKDFVNAFLNAQSYASRTKPDFLTRKNGKPLLDVQLDKEMENVEQLANPQARRIFKMLYLLPEVERQRQKELVEGPNAKPTLDLIRFNHALREVIAGAGESNIRPEQIISFTAQYAEMMKIIHKSDDKNDKNPFRKCLKERFMGAWNELNFASLMSAMGIEAKFSDQRSDKAGCDLKITIPGTNESIVVDVKTSRGQFGHNHTEGSTDLDVLSWSGITESHVTDSTLYPASRREPFLYICPKKEGIIVAIDTGVTSIGKVSTERERAQNIKLDTGLPATIEPISFDPDTEEISMMAENMLQYLSKYATERKNRKLGRGALEI